MVITDKLKSVLDGPFDVLTETIPSVYACCLGSISTQFRSPPCHIV